MRSIKLLTVAVLAIILALSSTQSVSAQQISVSPTCGPPGTLVTVTGSGFVVSAQPYCDVVSSPPGLVADSNCHVWDDGSLLNTWFIVASGASGSYSVTVSYFEQVSDPVGFSTDCPGGEAAVGGCVQPVNALGLISPWLAVIASVVCIGTIVVAAKKRRS